MLKRARWNAKDKNKVLIKEADEVLESLARKDTT